MKSINFLFLLSFLVLAGACDLYLSEPPDNRQEIRTLDDLLKVLYNAYPKASYFFTERSTDNVTVISSFGVNNTSSRALFRFEENKYHDEYWNSAYKAIAHANLVLEMVDHVPNSNPQLKKAVRGEALLCRAYAHFILANIHCQHYSAETADQHLGIPYLMEIEKGFLEKYTRGTLANTYQRIEKDLLEGVALMGETADKNYHDRLAIKYHFNAQSAYAFASRFYLFKGDYAKSVDYANKLLGDGIAPGVFVRNASKVMKGKKGRELAASFQDELINANLLSVIAEGACTVCHGDKSSRYEPNEVLYDKVFARNLQRSIDYRDIREGDETQPNYARYTTKSVTGFPVTIFRAEEVIFNRMECYVRLQAEGKMPDGIDKALKDYHVIASLRYEKGGKLTKENVISFFKSDDAGDPIDFAGTVEEKAIMKFIIHERRKEFFDEGLRWFDFKRLGLGLKRKDFDKVYELKKQDPRKAFAVPLRARLAGGLKETP